ncbi:MAG: c-type cytochrome, partial [Acidimicrobiales bacterium]
APAPAPPPPPKPDPPYVAAAKNRQKIPWWAMPVLAGLPVWAGLYAWTLESPSEGETDPLVLGQELYENTCASCHTASGGGQDAGGSAPVDFREGALLDTWPNWRNHVAWVTLGSQGWPGGSYGAQEKPIKGGMPAHEGTLTAEEIALVVRYERETLAGLDPEEEPDLVAITDAIGLGESTTADGENVEDVLTEAQEPGDGPGGTSEPPPE